MTIDQIIEAIKDLPSSSQSLVFATLTGEDDLIILFRGSLFGQGTLLSYITKAWHDDITAAERGQ